MPTRPFLDTNVLVYAFSVGDRRGETAKAILAGGGALSVQVANEFVDVVRKKLRWPWEDVVAALESVRAVIGDPLPLSDETHLLGIDISRRYGLRIYDSLIVGSAKQAGCRLLYTEDMQDGQTIEGVLIRNPFADP